MATAPLPREAPRLQLRSGAGTFAVVAALVVPNLIRLASAPLFELVPQEAYYFLYSQHLALSYFDHPPVLAYVLRLFTEVLGKNELSLRLAAFSLSVLTQLAWLDLARRHLGPGWDFAALLLLPTGMVTVTSLISTPDGPLLLFWTLAVHQLYGALFESRRRCWFTAGLAMGLAFDSKYTGLFLQGGLVLFLLLSDEHRRWLRTPWPWAGLAVAQFVMTPVYAWNAQHGFASFLFQTADRASHSTGLGLRWTLALFGTQSALLGVPLFIALLALAVRPHRLVSKAPTDARTARLFLACFFVPAFLAFLGISFVALVKPNWMMPAYVTGVILAAGGLRRRWLWVNLAFCGLIHVLAAIELLFYPIRLQSDDTWKGWRALGRQVEERAAQYPGAFIASADGYKTAAELRFYTALEVYGPSVVGQPGLQFDYIDPNPAMLKGRDAIFIDSVPRDFTPTLGPRVPDYLAAHFSSADEADPIVIVERGQVIRKFRVYSCHNYLGNVRP
ncbi:MAG TPA: glycosyltransferase family 39 protein [Myxococcaceae bacterium]|nr:glycosyltransferase family 39 protein [Myxococcaceae bacterium]